ncbi:MAG: ABC transporter permease [Planctomycetes bacterium]|nr:ABC transporter permease [Planctomycetota bacterium]
MANPIIDVRPQHKIPLAKASALCLKGITHRLFRSLLTLMVIVLAVAFFMTLLCESAFTRAVGAGVKVEAAQQRIPDRRAKTWFSQPSTVLLADRLGSASAAELDEFASVSGFDRAIIGALAADSRSQAGIVSFFESMDAGSRAVLVGNAKGREVLDRLREPDQWATFAEGMRHVHSYALLMPMAQMKDVIERRPGYQRDLEGFSKAWAGGVSRFTDDVARLTGSSTERDWRAWLITADDSQTSAFTALLKDHGFSDPPQTVAAVRTGLAEAKLRDQIASALEAPDAVNTWKKLFLNDPSPDQKMGCIADKRVEQVLAGKWTHARLVEVGNGIDHERQISELEKVMAQRMPDQRAGTLINGRQAFLMAISFVVCMVGIANAMLMAITERFREIATMKCLGATDGFILQQFLMEAAIQGLAGGVVGTAIGAVLAVAKGSAVYGSYLYGYFPMLDILIAGVICVATGILLSTLASIYPSWSASRMAPMDAMRVE